MLEYWFKEKRTLVDFRRDLLGVHFDGFAAYLQAKGYARHTGCELLAKCCQFNAFLLEQRVERCDQICAARVEAFPKAYYAHLPEPVYGYSPRRTVRRAIKCLFDYLIQIKVRTPPKPERIIKPFDWLLLHRGGLRFGSGACPLWLGDPFHGPLNTSSIEQWAMGYRSFKLSSRGSDRLESDLE